MNSEATLWAAAVCGVLTLLNIGILPEDMQAIQAIVQLFVIGGGFAAVRRFVASRKTVEGLVGPEKTAEVFDGKPVN